ncbi:MAG: TetR/AcrR family transcriptional regulator [Actinobacteria bacterium]|nr:MAG: TetR/AcrR family transcriptional regulator [Actinomycetota bacterium]
MAATGERRRLPVAERRELIVAAAGHLFGEAGYDGTRLDDIAAAAGVTKPVLYRHFDSKRDLYLALLRRHRDDLPTFVGDAPAEGSLRDWLRAILDRWLEYVEAHAYAWRMLFRDSGGGPEVQAVRREVHARAREVLADVIRSVGRARIPAQEAEPLAELMSMGMASLVLWWMDNPEAPRGALIDAMARAWAGLFADPA